MFALLLLLAVTSVETDEDQPITLSPPRICEDFKLQERGKALDPIGLKESWTIALYAKPTAEDDAIFFTHGTARGRRGTAVFGLATLPDSKVCFFSGGGKADDHTSIAEVFVPNRSQQFHLYTIVKYENGMVVFSVDGRFSGCDEGLWAEPNWGYIGFNGIHWRGAGMGFKGGPKSSYGIFRVWDRALGEDELKALAREFKPQPDNLPVPKEKMSAFVDTNSVLRLGRELPPMLTIGKGGEKRLYAKGILAQCAVGTEKRLELNTGGRLAVGSDGLDFDSNYARGNTNEIVFAGGTLAAYENSFIESSAPILLEAGTVTKLVVPKLLQIKASFRGEGTLEVLGGGKVVFFRDSSAATGKLILNKVAAVFSSSGSWGGEIVKRSGATIKNNVEKRIAAQFPEPATGYHYDRLQREKLGRGLIAWRSNTNEVTISWRYLESDPVDIAFDVYMDAKVVKRSVKNSTQITLPYDGKPHRFSVVADSKIRKFENSKISYMLPANAPIGYLELKLNPPKDTTAPDGRACSYFPQDCSVGDLDGDGEYELVLEWGPTLQSDNSGYAQTCPTYLEGLKLDGSSRSLWRINLGPNIRSGAHYTPFIVYDLDGDGKAELVVRTADGTVDGKGKTLNNGEFKLGNKFKDWRIEDSHVVFAPNYVTVFNGLDGHAVDTLPFRPAVHEDPKVIENKDYGAICHQWRARNAGNQAFRFLSAVGYLDGIHPSVIMCRGYYSKTCLWALDFDGKKLSEHWFFDSETPRWKGYGGQGNHNLRVGDVDFDGKDEIIYGSMTVDHDGKGKYTLGLGHGDALHLIQRSPEVRGLQVFGCHESCGFGIDLHNAETGEVLFRKFGPVDTGSCNAVDCDPREKGVELFSGANVGFYSGNDFHRFHNPKSRPRDNYYGCLRFGIWWKGDLTRQMFSGGSVIKHYDVWGRYIYPVADFGDEVESVHGSKGAPCLIADVFGDWREEILLKTKDNRSIRIYPSPIPTEYRFHTFMHDPVYRISVATENCGYNVPTDPGFYFGPDLLGHDIIFRGMPLK